MVIIKIQTTKTIRKKKQSQTNKLLVNVRVGVLNNLLSQSRNVNTTITLTTQPSRTANELGVGSQKSFNEVEVVVGRLGVIWERRGEKGERRGGGRH